MAIIFDHEDSPNEYLDLFGKRRMSPLLKMHAEGGGFGLLLLC
jgi:hypothetical protein